MRRDGNAAPGPIIQLVQTGTGHILCHDGIGGHAGIIEEGIIFSLQPVFPIAGIVLRHMEGKKRGFLRDEISPARHENSRTGEKLRAERQKEEPCGKARQYRLSYAMSTHQRPPSRMAAHTCLEIEIPRRIHGRTYCPAGRRIGIEHVAGAEDKAVAHGFPKSGSRSVGERSQ